MDQQPGQDRTTSATDTRPTDRRSVTAAAVVGVLATATVGGVAPGRSTAATTLTAASVTSGHRSTSTAATRPATAAEEAGVVDITTVLDYGAGRAAGTGIVLAANGEILTNNHVVDGATAVTVTVPATGARCTATVVGTDPSDDIAVLRPAAASGLTTASLATADNTAGALVTAVAAHRPQDRVHLTWADAAGDTHTATVTLAAGPAD
jgi:S1-C subfamily serine protease